MTALLYARVSTEDQAEKYGLSSQVHALHVLAAARGYERVARWSPVTRSPSRPDALATRRAPNRA